MFGDLKIVVDLLKDGAAAYDKRKSMKQRKEAVHRLLRTYFLLVDSVEEAEALLADAGPDPAARVGAMKPLEAGPVLERWSAALHAQGGRLYDLAGAVFSQDFLTVIDRDLQQKIDQVAGDKMDRSLTLSGIGAALVMRTYFPLDNTPEETARYVAVMAGAEDDALDMAQITGEIAALRASLDQYRAVVERIVPDDEIMELASAARSDAAKFPRIYRSIDTVAVAPPAPPQSQS